MSTLVIIREELEDAKDTALRVYEANKASGAPASSVGFDSGRYDGLKQAIEIIDSLVTKEITKAIGGAKA